MTQNPALGGVFYVRFSRARCSSGGARGIPDEYGALKPYEWRKQSVIEGGAESLVNFADVNEGLDSISTGISSVSC